MRETTISYVPDGLSASHLREPHWEWTPPPDGVWILRVGLRPVAVVRHFRRSLRTPDLRMLSVLGLGGVFTDVEYRRHGHATTLLRHIVAVSIPVAACLFASDGRLYHRLGFVEVQHGFWLKPLAPGLEVFERDPHVDGQPWQLEPSGKF